MKKSKSSNYIFFLLFCFPYLLFSQNYSQQSQILSNGGGLVSGAEYENFIIIGESILSSEISSEIYSGAIGFLTEPNGFVNVEDENIVPEKFYLKQNYPNPFNPETTIAFNLPHTSKVCLEIFNIKGQKVLTLINEEKEAGFHEIIWNGLDRNRKKVSSGIYFFRIQTKDNQSLRKMIMLK